MNRHFEEDLRKTHEFHGHICAGIIIGVRLARAGLSYLGIDDPSENRDFMVYCEIDRCLTDAVQCVTGLSLGKRRLKLREYGKMAASFIDMNTGNGIRLVCYGHINAPESADLIEFWNAFTDEEIFKTEPVFVDIPPEDRPGKPVRSAVCGICGEKIMDAKDVTVDGKTMCRACAYGTYYEKV